jgi:hypothetical protein
MVGSHDDAVAEPRCVEDSEVQVLCVSKRHAGCIGNKMLS